MYVLLYTLDSRDEPNPDLYSLYRVTYLDKKPFFVFKNAIIVLVELGLAVLLLRSDWLLSLKFWGGVLLVFDAASALMNSVQKHVIYHYTSDYALYGLSAGATRARTLSAFGNVGCALQFILPAVYAIVVYLF